jgi:hypothetical protein
VVGQDGLTFEGRKTTWEELPELLRALPNRASTVLEVAIASDEMSVRMRTESFAKAITLAHQLGFEYASDVGVDQRGGSPLLP